MIGAIGSAMGAGSIGAGMSSAAGAWSGTSPSVSATGGASAVVKLSPGAVALSRAAASEAGGTTPEAMLYTPAGRAQGGRINTAADAVQIVADATNTYALALLLVLLARRSYDGLPL